MFLLDTAHWFTNVLVAREARALTVTGLEVRICMGMILVQVGRCMLGGDGPLITFVTFLRCARGEGQGGEVSKSRVGVARGHGYGYARERFGWYNHFS